MANETQSIKQMLRNIDHQPLAVEEEKKLLRRAKRRVRKARDRLVEANQRFVVRMAIQYSNQGLSVTDLVQEGNLGLMEAIDRYDFARECRLISYASWWIRLYMQRAIEQKSRTVTIPINKVASLKKIRNFEYNYVKTNGKKPSYEEIGVEIDMPADKVEKICNLGTSSVSIHSEDEDGQCMEDRLSFDQSDELHHTIWLGQLKHRLHNALSRLSQREQAVLECRFGLQEDDPLSLRQAGRKLGLSAEGVRQIQAQAIRKLRDPDIGGGLHHFATQ